MFSDSKGAYAVLDTHYDLILYDLQSAIKKNEVVPDLEKLDQLSKLTGDSNPVVFFYEFK